MAHARITSTGLGIADDREDLWEDFVAFATASLEACECCPQVEEDRYGFDDTLEGSVAEMAEMSATLTAARESWLRLGPTTAKR